MMAQANCRANVLRGDTETQAGDFVQAGDAFTAVYERKPFYITERSRRVYDPSTGVPRTIRVVIARCDGRLVMQEDDQIHDLTHGRLFTVLTCYRPDSVVAQADWNLELQRTTGGAHTP